MATKALPSCGIYRTGVALAGREAAVGEGALVYFHSHSQQGPPIVLLPAENRANRWTFNERGYLISGEGADHFLAALIPLPRQGYYAVTQAIGLVEGRTLEPRQLVQVGYNLDGQAILFPAEFSRGAFSFPERGFRFNDLTIFDRLREAGFDAPLDPSEDATVH